MTRARIAWVGVWAISLVAVFHLGARQRSDAEAAPRPLVSTRLDPAPRAAIQRCALDEAQVHRWVADAIAAKLEGGTSPAVARRPTDASENQEPEFDPELAARTYKRGSEILDVAIARGAWTRDDAGELRPLILQLPMEPRHSLLDRLFNALNGHQLRSEIVGPPI